MRVPIQHSTLNIQHSVGIYVHLPFCRAHCTYCPFVISTDLSQQDAYIEALVEEIAAKAGGEAVDTLYFGGCTPSRTSAENLARAVRAIRSRFAPTPDAQFTLETN